MLEDIPVTGTEPAKTQLYGTNPHGDTEILTHPATGQTTATYRYTGYGTTANRPGVSGERVGTSVLAEASIAVRISAAYRKPNGDREELLTARRLLQEPRLPRMPIRVRSC